METFIYSPVLQGRHGCSGDGAKKAAENAFGVAKVFAAAKLGAYLRGVTLHVGIITALFKETFDSFHEKNNPPC